VPSSIYAAYRLSAVVLTTPCLDSSLRPSKRDRPVGEKSHQSEANQSDENPAGAEK